MILMMYNNFIHLINCLVNFQLFYFIVITLKKKKKTITIIIYLRKKSNLPFVFEFIQILQRISKKFINNDNNNNNNT